MFKANYILALLMVLTNSRIRPALPLTPVFRKIFPKWARTVLYEICSFWPIRPGSKIPYKADVGLSVDTQALGQIRLPLNKTGELTTPTIPQIDKFDLKKFL